jgi:ParB-like chromosome segregation protein Spo0J
MCPQNSVRASFQPNVVTLPLAIIVPLREIPASLRSTQKFKQIAASLDHVGLIEPLVVFPTDDGQYWLLDGHVRLDILQSKGVLDARCLLATDDEAYTYNKRVNYLPAIAEHFMILKAIANGISEERIAETLNVDVASIKRKRNLLDGICAEATELLKDRRITADVLTVLRKMKPIRQVEAAELMIAAGNYTVKHAKTLLIATHSESLINPTKVGKFKGVSPAQKAIMEQESESLLQDLKAAEESYGEDILGLTISCRYLEGLLKNTQIKRFLTKHHPDLLEELSRILAQVDATRFKPRPTPEKAARKLANSA